MSSRVLNSRSRLLPPGIFLQLRWWSRRQWIVAAVVTVLAFVVIGEIGETLPNASHGRSYPVEWWNYATLALSAVLIGLTAGTFVVRTGHRVATGAGSGAAGTVAAIAMACPVCSPLAIPLLGVGGALSFLTPLRGVISLVSVAVLAVSLLLRLRASTRCAAQPAPRQLGGEPQAIPQA